jgi:hypothetical protein
VFCFAWRDAAPLFTLTAVAEWMHSSVTHRIRSQGPLAERATRREHCIKFTAHKHGAPASAHRASIAPANKLNLLIELVSEPPNPVSIASVALINAENSPSQRVKWTVIDSVRSFACSCKWKRAGRRLVSLIILAKVIHGNLKWSASAEQFLFEQNGVLIIDASFVQLK